MGNTASSSEIRDVDVAVDSKTGYVSIKELINNSKKKRQPFRKYLKLRAPTVRQDGKRMYWLVIDQDETEELVEAEDGIRVTCATSLLKMLTKAILDGPIGALLGLPKSDT